MIVQIYEIQTPNEAEKCIELGVNHIGSVLLSKKSWREPMLKETIRLSNGTESKNSLIPLFQDFDTMCRALDYYRPQYIHFCDSLTDCNGREIHLDARIEFQSELKEKFPEMGVIRSIPVPRDDCLFEFPTLRLACALEPISDLFLTDTWLGKEPVDGYIGITGQTSNFKTAKELVLKSRIPVILAGGLSPGNVFEAALNVAPAGVDSCTRTNKVDGRGAPLRFKKDFQRVEKFIVEARKAEKILGQ